MAVVDQEVREALVNFAIAELAKPPTNHVLSFVKSELSSSRHHLLTALLISKEESERKSNAQSDVKVSYLDLKSSNAEDYKNHFRMNRKTIQKLVSVMGKKCAASPEIVHPLVPVEKKVLLTAWLMGNKQSFMAAAKIFELSKGTVYRIFHQICNELTKLAAQYVFWPDADECDHIAASFESSYGFPGVIGVIDACHVEIREPESTEETCKFLNFQTGQYTVMLQVVVDHKTRFRDVCAGFPGQTSKSKVLVGSPLYSKLTSRTEPLIEPNKHLLGGTEYPQLSTLLTPYAGEDLTPQEQKYNELHQEICAVVEQVFGKLKERFQRLSFIDVSRTELASKVVVAACVLHNFALMHDDTFST